MATLAQDDKQINQNGQGQAGTGAPSGSFAGSGSLSTQPSTAGVGAGGGGGWTNIQSYLTANQGNQGSANALKSQVGGSFDQEQKNLDQSASQSKQQADQQVSQNHIGQDQASQMVQQMGQNYQYNGQQNDQYNQNKNQFQTALNAQYQGPQSYTYGMGAQAQQYGQNLNNNFNAVMENVYNKSAGGQMGSGAMALQHQLDQDNPYVNQARQDLVNQYAGLQGNIQNTTQATNQAIQGDVGQFQKDQSDLRGYLTGQENQSLGNIDSAIKAYNDQQAGNQGGAAFDWADAAKGLTDQRAINAINMAQADPNKDALVKGYNALGLSKYNFDPTKTTRENVAGVDSDRSRYDAIADALGVGGQQIAKSDTGPDVGQWGLNTDLINQKMSTDPGFAQFANSILGGQTWTI